MKNRHPNVKCIVTWCDYWVRISGDNIGNHIGGCDTWDLVITTLSGDKIPTCASYKIHRDPMKRGIHGDKMYCPYCGKTVEDLDMHMSLRHPMEDLKDLIR